MSETRATALGRTRTLPALVASELKRRVFAHEWPEGGQLPTESALAEQYSVSRQTVRSALRSLEDAGLVRTRHGVGTFVTPFGTAIRAGLQDLRSMSETIAEQGHEPGMEYRTRDFRVCTDEEAERLGLRPGSEVLFLERAITADGEVVAFAVDLIAADLLPSGFDAESVTGSVFAVLETYQLLPAQAVAQVRAVLDPDVGWGPDKSPKGLYLCLDQTQYLRDGRPLSLSHIYFIEDRFQFLIVRRP